MTTAAQAVLEMEQMGYTLDVHSDGDARRRLAYHHPGPLEDPRRAEQLLNVLYQHKAEALAFLEERAEELLLDGLSDFLERHGLQGRLTWPNKTQAPVLDLFAPVSSEIEKERLMSLSSIMRGLFKEAFAQRGRRTNFTLPNGLHIVLYVAADNSNHLLIYRYHRTPSLTEWETVIHRWPQVLPDPPPAPEEKSDPVRKALAAAWYCPALPAIEQDAIAQGETHA